MYKKYSAFLLLVLTSANCFGAECIVENTAEFREALSEASLNTEHNVITLEQAEYNVSGSSLKYLVGFDNYESSLTIKGNNSTLVGNGVRIFEYTPSMLHAKNIIIDEWVLIGTSNLNHRSLLHDLEVDVVIKLNSSKQKLIKQFHEDLSLSKEIKNPFLQRRHWAKRFIGRIIMQIKFFM